MPSVLSMVFGTAPQAVNLPSSPRPLKEILSETVMLDLLIKPRFQIRGLHPSIYFHTTFLRRSGRSWQRLALGLICTSREGREVGHTSLQCSENPTPHLPSKSAEGQYAPRLPILCSMPAPFTIKPMNRSTLCRTSTQI